MGLIWLEFVYTGLIGLDENWAALTHLIMKKICLESIWIDLIWSDLS